MEKTSSGKDEEQEVASVAYRYRKWDLGNGITLVCRCEHDAVMIGPNGENQFINIKSLNEWDSKLAHGVDWRQKLDSQRGAVVATELKNNSCKLAKWTVGSLLAGSDQVKFGYVSRASPRDSTKHVILGTHQFKPSEFANQINLNLDNAWGILRCIVDTCMKLKEGKYLIMKDPNKPMIRIYDIPDDTFESDDDDDDDEEEEEDDDSDDEDDESDEDDDDDDRMTKKMMMMKRPTRLRRRPSPDRRKNLPRLRPRKKPKVDRKLRRRNRRLHLRRSLGRPRPPPRSSPEPLLPLLLPRKRKRKRVMSER